ncbi:MAG: hypothetical protein JSU05_15920 [Bacteroidetes bacterium]|nr:hypothetical protein [Bacteroidota bacterium]
MKKNKTAFSWPVRMIVFSLVTASVLCVQPVFANSKPVKSNPVVNNTNKDDKKPAKKTKATKTTDAVKVFPDIIKKSMHVVARSGNDKEISFFVFDLTGKLMLNYKMKAGERRTVENLPKGDYVYHVFCGDEETETGKMEFR